MSGSVSSPVPSAPSLAADSFPTPHLGPASRVRRLFLIPIRFARRRPRRTVGLILVFLLAVGGLSACGVVVWYQYHLRGARRAIELGHTAVAIRHLESCRSIYQDHPEVLLLGARLARRSGYLEEAEAFLDRYWAVHGDSEGFVSERLFLRVAQGDVESTESSILSRISSDGPDAPLAREALIGGLMYRFRWAEAFDQIQRWLRQSPDNTAGLYLEGKLQQHRDDITGATQIFQRLLEIDPEHDDARRRLASLLIQRSQGTEALPHLNYLRQTIVGDTEIDMLWIRALALVGRSEEARSALDEFVRFHPHSASALAERGRFAVTDGDDLAAEEYLRRATVLDPGNSSVRHQFALALTRNNKFEEAERERKAVDRVQADSQQIKKLIEGPYQKNPYDAAIHYEIAMIAIRAGLATEGLRWLKSALQVDPNHLATHRTLAVYYQEAGNPVLASKHRALAHQLGSMKRP